MKLLLGTLATIVQSVDLQVEHDHPFSHTHAASQEECDRLNTSTLYSYKFNQRACACFFEYNINIPVNCDPETERFNPFKVPYQSGGNCISNADYAAIFDHNLGPTCRPPDEPEPGDGGESEGGGEESEEESTQPDPVDDPVIRHVSSPDECADGTSFDLLACSCFQDQVCDINCAELYPATPIQNPLQECECISSQSFNDIYNHKLENCGSSGPIVFPAGSQTAEDCAEG